jgi:hypothetical protein
MVCSSCGSNEAMYCARCFHSSRGRTAENTVGTQPTDVQQLKAEIAALADVVANDKSNGGGCVVNLVWLLKELRQLSSV